MASRNTQFRDRGVGAALAAPLIRMAWAGMVTVGLLLAAWGIDGVFVFHVWPEGVGRLRAILAEDLGRAIRLGGEASLLTRLVVGTANTLYALVFEMTGVHEMGLHFAEGTALSIPDTITRSAYIAHQAEIEVAMVGTQLFGVRIGLLMGGIPLLALGYVVALADGLVHRAVRRACGGRESSSLYHRAKLVQVTTVAGMLAGVLLLPISFDSRWVWVPACFLLAMAASVQWRYYKKHL